MGSSFGYLLVVVGAAGAVLVTDLGDRGHVDRVVDPAVAAQRQAVHFPVPRRHLDRGGAVVGGEVIAAREPGNVAGVSDDGPGVDGADAEDLGEGGARGPDRGGQLLPGVPQLGIKVAQVSEELGGELGAGQLDGTGWRGRLQDSGGLSCGNLPKVAARDQIAEYGVEPACDLVAVPGQVTVALGLDLQDRRVIIGDHLTAAPGA
jgi:hypothetical protein